METEQPGIAATGGTVKTATCIDAIITTRKRPKPSTSCAMAALTTPHIRNSSKKAKPTTNNLKICATCYIPFYSFMLYNDIILTER